MQDNRKVILYDKTLKKGGRIKAVVNCFSGNKKDEYRLELYSTKQRTTPCAVMHLPEKEDLIKTFFFIKNTVPNIKEPSNAG